LQLAIESGNFNAMNSNLSERHRKTEIGYEPDGQWQEHLWVEVKSETHGFRNLRASILGLAYWLTTAPDDHGLLVLVDSRIGDERLRKEWQFAEKALHPDVMRRLKVAVVREKQYIGLPEDLGADFRFWLDQLVMEHSQSTRPRESFYAILEILLHQWLLEQGPMTSDWLMKTAGCSPPTVRDALRRLDYCLRRHTDRRVELRHFPKDEWARLVAVSDTVRSTVRFADRSGQPRSPESLLRRLQRLGRTDIAVGGVWGAKHYQPDLDLVGNPRLDLCLHISEKRVDWGFVEQLDPALEITKRRDESPVLVVHVVHRASSLFQPNNDGLPWADPVECLLDLHEARLEPQARDFLNSFPAAKDQI
jgi:hypothetical protein